MLSRLAISHFAIIEDLTLDFASGFTVITGETGAGKSILVDALGLLVGERAEASWVRAGRQRAELVAEFDLDDAPAATDWLQQAELDDDGQCLLRRVIAATGRSRAFINGTQVTLKELQTLGSQLLEIHGQHEFQALTASGSQLALLDASGDYHEALQDTAAAYTQWREARAALAELDEAEDGDHDPQYLRFQISELEAAALPSEELTALEREHDRLSHGEDILSGLDTALKALSEDNGALGQLATVSRELERLQRLAPQTDEAATMLQEARINLVETERALNDIASELQPDPQRLQQIDRQLGKLHDLARKHRCEPAELTTVLERLQASLERMENADRLREDLQTAVDQIRETYQTRSDHLAAQRSRHAEQLARGASRHLDALGLSGGEISIHLEHRPQSPPSPDGQQKVEFMVMLNPGQPAQPLRKVASGGELSRLSLALKTAGRAAGGAPTLVFDEVDAGIGGQTARSVGAVLAELAGSAQTLCVTHLAQVASLADHQYSVRKLSGDQATAVTATLLDGAARVEEIARMLGGDLSDSSRAHAKELLAVES